MLPGVALGASFIATCPEGTTPPLEPVSMGVPLPAGINGVLASSPAALPPD